LFAGESVALAGWSCAPCGAGAAACKLCGCAAKANENRRLSRIAATPKKRQETTVIVRTDERRKIPSRNLPEFDAIPHPSPSTSYSWSSPPRSAMGCVQPGFRYSVPGTRYWPFLLAQTISLPPSSLSLGFCSNLGRTQLNPARYGVFRFLNGFTAGGQTLAYSKGIPDALSGQASDWFQMTNSVNLGAVGSRGKQGPEHPGEKQAKAEAYGQGLGR
jgi:hypothetical protein